MPPSPRNAAELPRRNDIDTLRVFAFALLILYHIAMLYVADWSWHLKSSYQTDWLQWPMLILNRWRMELLFVVSGLAVHFLRRRGNSRLRFLSARTLRLLLPLLFGIAVVVPIQPYCQGVVNGAVEPGFWRFLANYYSGHPWPPHAFDGWQYGWTWNHLWYLAYLWVYTVLLTMLLGFFESPAGERLRGRLTSLRGLALLFLPGLPLAAYACLLQDRFPETHDLLHDGFMHPVYFTMFLYGYCIGTTPGLWWEFERLRWRGLAWAIGFCAAYLCMIQWADDDTPQWLVAGVRMTRWTYMWLAIVTLFGWAHRYLNRPFRWLPYAREAVYPWYMLHQSLIVACAYVLVPLHLGPVVEPALVLLGTVGGCALLHELLIRRNAVLRPLFGLNTSSNRPRIARVEPAAGLEVATRTD